MSTLVVFARVPERGCVKTRLATAMGDDAALLLYEAFLDDTLAIANEVASACGAEIVVAVAGHGWTRSAFVPQPAGDLGARIGALVDAYVATGPVCIIGSDAPTLAASQIVRAFAELETHEVVIGPGVDGGYWLIGARRSIPELLCDMPWSTPAVLGETLARLEGRSVSLVDFWYDVDEASDVALLRAHLGVLPIDVAPATRRALAQLSR